MNEKGDGPIRNGPRKYDDLKKNYEPKVKIIEVALPKRLMGHISRW